MEFADPHPLSAGPLDDVFGNLVRDPDGLARFHVEGGRERITVAYGPKYTVAVVYAPGSGLHLLRADVGNHQRLQPGARRSIQRATERGPGRNLERELLVERGVTRRR